ncbi:MAG: cyclic nucleotide-binding domain-containing protein [Microthrixaceae bacterium]|nr:cyclic nucleotide-binding domain-containing protein [Microthrixaceae bacterium]MCO5311770.1 cyclic nucleotide-binding domain-containing protein [Microthrixaceae bacterium]HPB44524.1 cyclic nucleotide-binding domain-containing protein [Microthrixaceae bacterium]
MSRFDYLEPLRNIRLFHGCSDKELEQVARLSDEVDIAEGHRIVEQGDSAREAFVILEGTATVVLDNRAIAELSVGDHFGELALLDGGTRTANVDAATPMRLLVIHRPAFMGLLDEQPGIARKIMATLAGIIRDLEHPPGG